MPNSMDEVVKLLRSGQYEDITRDRPPETTSCSEPPTTKLYDKVVWK